MADLLRGLDLVLAERQRSLERRMMNGSTMGDCSLAHLQGRRDEVITTRQFISRILDADAFGGKVEDGR